MTTYERLNLVVGLFTLGVLSWTLCVLRKYARDTNTLARTSVEQLPRPCVVLKRSADSSPMAVFLGETTSLSNKSNSNEIFLIFMNVGTGPAVNCRYHVRDTEETGKGEPSYQQLPEIGPSDSFESLRILNKLPENAVVSIEYESVAGSLYQTEQRIEDRKLVQETRFVSPFASKEVRRRIWCGTSRVECLEKQSSKKE